MNSILKKHKTPPNQDPIITGYLNSFKMRSKYCFYDCDKDPEKIAFNGKCRIFISGFLVYDIKGYKSKILNKPTFKEIFNKCCDAYIKTSGNTHDIYFTGIDTDYFPRTEDINARLLEPYIIDPDKVYNIEMFMDGMNTRFTDYLKLNNITV